MSWLRDYLEYTNEQESPEEFHFWTGLTLLSAALGRKVWLDRRSGGVTYYKIYPGGLAVVLVAGSGWARKSTVSKTGTRLLRRVKHDLGLDIIPGSISPEKLMRRLAGNNLDPLVIEGSSRVTPKDATAFVDADELAIFLSRNTYNESMSTLLLKLLDAPDFHEHDTISGQRVELHNVCIVLHGTTTPIGLGESVHSHVQGTGFTRRVIFVYSANRRKANALVDIDDEDVDPARLARVRDLEESLCARLVDYNKLAGRVTYTADGREWFRDWYVEYSNNPMNQTEGWPTSRPDHMLKIATLIRLSEHGDLVLDSGSLAAADLALQKVELDFDRVFQLVGQHQTAKLIEKIEVLLRKKGGRAETKFIYNQMYRYFNDIEELKRALLLMREAGRIERMEVLDKEYFTLTAD